MEGEKTRRRGMQGGEEAEGPETQPLHGGGDRNAGIMNHRKKSSKKEEIPGRKYGERSSCCWRKCKMTHLFSKAIWHYALEMFRACDPALPAFEVSLRKTSLAILWLSPS